MRLAKFCKLFLNFLVIAGLGEKKTTSLLLVGAVLIVNPVRKLEWGAIKSTLAMYFFSAQRAKLSF